MTTIKLTKKLQKLVKSIEACDGYIEVVLNDEYHFGNNTFCKESTFKSVNEFKKTSVYTSETNEYGCYVPAN